jgi:hypothetical protein
MMAFCARGLIGAYRQAGITDVRAQIITIEDFDEAVLLAVAAHPHQEDK